MKESNESKLGPGILSVSIIQLVIYIFALAGMILTFLFYGSANQQAAFTDPDGSITTGRLMISLVLLVLLILGVVLILLKKAVGVYIYFICVLINIVFLFINNSDTINILFNLILPLLMAYFIFRKKELFGFNKQT